MLRILTVEEHCIKGVKEREAGRINEDVVLAINKMRLYSLGSRGRQPHISLTIAKVSGVKSLQKHEISVTTN